MADSKSFNPGLQAALCENPGGEEGFIPPELSDDMFKLFSELIYRESGIKLGAAKKGLLVSRLGKRLVKSGAGSLTKYYRIVKSDDRERGEMLNCISTNTTNFFREPHHFQYLRDRVIPELLESRACEKTLRMWSAGCSTGEEPYSMAITVLEAISDNDIRPENWDIKILATDISTRALETAGSGIYDQYQLPENVPNDVMSKYFLKGVDERKGTFKVKGFVQDMVRLRRLNFMENSYPFSKEFDVIMCRNVMIYFDEPMKQHVLSMFHRHLCNMGHLFLGHSETMIGNDQFAPVNVTVYRKK